MRPKNETEGVPKDRCSRHTNELGDNVKGRKKHGTGRKRQTDEIPIGGTKEDEGNGRENRDDSDTKNYEPQRHKGSVDHFAYFWIQKLHHFDNFWIHK